MTQSPEVWLRWSKASIGAEFRGAALSGWHPTCPLQASKRDNMLSSGAVHSSCLVEDKGDRAFSKLAGCCGAGCCGVR